ncbi:hypothetical protein J3R30DRAFT_3509155 [Lentinula aciculospora]|uniref:Uncharacterized protein n=1 Tax=Lentinula aciculospora TaxID=153920 RepID=A0A9W9A799_9AGAR|nr:hypothetical protein J3R30DRAFT_3509155 [Lentinula aciculospora]
MIRRLPRAKRTGVARTFEPSFLAQVVASPASSTYLSYSIRCRSKWPPSNHRLVPRSRSQPFCTPKAHSGSRYMSNSGASSSHNDINFDVPEVEASLGLRQANPPDTHPNTSRRYHTVPPDGEDKSRPEVAQLSDAEWEIRTGRTIDILRETLPTFFNTGLMTSWDPETGEAYPSPSLPMPHLPNLHLPPLHLPIHLSPDPRNQEPERQTNGKGNGRGKKESIYSSRIHLTYTPPSPLPHPFPEKLTLDGKPLYLASAVFIRHTLNTLYSDLRVILVKVAVSVPKDKSSSDSDSKSTPPLPLPELDPDLGSVDDPHTKNSGYKREKSLYIALRVTGTSRVSGALGQWEVRSTYTFSPLNAQIIKHTVNGIEPAPERGVWEGLAKVLGLGNNIGEGFGARQGEGALSGFGSHSHAGSATSSK